jgi:hypothetical protein
VDPEPFVSRVLDDEGLTAGLDGPAAEALVAWLVKRAEAIAASAKSESDARQRVDAVCRRGRTIARTVAAKPAAEQLAALKPLLDTESP